MTLHPEGKEGVNISRQMYEAIRDTIVDILRAYDGITFADLTTAVGDHLAGRFEGSIPWYVTTVSSPGRRTFIVNRCQRGGAS